MNHPCPHHCPGGASGLAGAATVAAVVAVAAFISEHAAGIADALWTIFAVIMAVCAAGITLLILLVRQPRQRPAPTPRERTRVRARVVEGIVVSPARPALSGSRRALPAGPGQRQPGQVSGALSRSEPSR